MSTRTITECDRCHREIKEIGRQIETRSGNNVVLDLCITCEDKLERFLHGDDLCECEPP